MADFLTEAQLNTIAIEFFERNTILLSEEFLSKKFPDKRSDAYILLTFEGHNKNELKFNYESAAEICIRELKAIDAFIVVYKSLIAILTLFLELKATFVTSSIDTSNLLAKEDIKAPAPAAHKVFIA